MPATTKPRTPEYITSTNQLKQRKQIEQIEQMATYQILILSQNDIKNTISYSEAIAVNKKAFLMLASGQAVVPTRLVFDNPSQQGSTLFKPAYVPNEVLGIKIVSVRPNNAAKNIPTVPGFMVLLNEETGLPVCMMDATYLTALRTAAGSAVATDVLASMDSKVLLVFGSGWQAEFHIEMMLAVRKIQVIHIVNRTKENAEKLAEVIRNRHPKVEVNVNAPLEEVVPQADIIVTATNSHSPLFSGELLLKNKRVHINAIGTYLPTAQELDESTMSQASIIVDSAAAFESGDITIPLEKGAITQQANIYGDLGTLLTSVAEGNIRSLKHVTVFKSVGTAVQDVCTAQAVYLCAVKNNLGTKVLL